MFFTPIVGYVEPTEAMQAIAADVRIALALSGIEVKEAAALMNLDEEHLRKQLKCAPGAHLSIYRMALLPMRFWQHLIAQRAKRIGQTVLEPDQIGAAIELMVRLFGKKTPVHMKLREERREEKVS